MMFIEKHERKLAWISNIIVFLALIRCILEPIRLNAYSTERLSFDAIVPFLWGALSAAVALFVMTILILTGRSRFSAVVAILTVSALIVIKTHYNL